METVNLATKPRSERGKRAVGRLRKQGYIPGVVYGHKLDTVSIAVSSEAIANAIRHKVRVVDLQLPNGPETTLIKEVQYDHLGREILHLDFERVSKDERIEVEIPLELRGVAPGLSAGVLDQPLHTLKVECLAIDIPESIRVNISAMQLGQIIHVKEVVLPPGVKALNDPDAVVVQIKAREAAPEVAVAAPVEGETAEPEIVGRRVAKEEEEPAKDEKKK